MSALATNSVEDRHDYKLRVVRTETGSGAIRRWRVRAYLLAADAMSTALSIWLVHALFVDVPVAFGNLGIATAVMLCFFAGAGLHTAIRSDVVERLRLRVMAAAAFSAILLVGTGATALSNVLAFAALLVTLTVAGYYAELAIIQLMRRRGLWPTAALVVGNGPKAEALVRELTRRPVLGLRPVAVLTPLALGDASVSGGTLAGVPAITSLNALPEPVDVAIAVCRPSLMALERLAGNRAREFASTFLLADGATARSRWLATRSLGTGIGIETHKAFRPDRSATLKRAMDIVLAAVAAIPAGVLTLLAALAVKIVDPGPAFYEQRRTGRDGCPIHVLKVRTMYTDSDRRLADHLDAYPEARKDWERRFKLVDDPRILPLIGPLLRKSSIDELPQIWNVLRGDMSMVGPRPFPDYHLRRFDDEFRAIRTSVPPGLTGFWQISTRSEGDLEAQKADDLFYIRNRSLWLDLYILLQTLPAVVAGTGAR